MWHRTTRLLTSLHHLPKSRPKRCRVCQRSSLYVCIGEGDEFSRCLYCGANLRYELLATCLRSMDLARRDVMELDPHSPLRPILRSARSYLRTYYRPGISAGTLDGGAICQDITRLTLPDASLDLIVSSDVLEHVPDAGAAFRESARVLRSGGVHLFTVPPRAVTRSRKGLRDEYHRDPLDKNGIIVFWDFGPDLPHVFATPNLTFRIAAGPEGSDGRFVWAAIRN